MQQGELILRSPLRDEGYWAALLLFTGGLWVALEKVLTQDALTSLTCGLLLAGALLRLTVLRRWHIYTAPWTLSPEKLTVGSKTLLLKDAESVKLEPGTFVRGSLYLVIKGRPTLRLAALVRGKGKDRSIQSIRELGWAVKQAMESPQGNQ